MSFLVSLLFPFYCVQFTSAFHSAPGFFGLAFGYQKLCLCRCGVAQKQFLDVYRNGRILGGVSTEPHQYPWLATIHTGLQSVTGSLISDRHVITAASTLFGIPSNKISVTLGSHNHCQYGDPSLNTSVTSVSIHPRYVHRNGANDVALIRLTHVVPFSQYISPICMPWSKGAEDPTQTVWVAATTLDTSCSPQVISLPVLPTRTCLKVGPVVTTDKGCLGPIGIKNTICETDIGAPVMTRGSVKSSYHLAGVVSSANCDNFTVPLYTRINDHVSWISVHLRDDCKCF